MALHDELAAMARGPACREERARAIVRALRGTGGYRWVGVYDVREREIAVLAWDGPGEPAHPLFPRDQGLCGAAAAGGETVVVGDVRSDPRYLTTLGTTRSEIVVPVRAGGAVVGLVDVESEAVNAFGSADRKLLERCADAIAPLWQ
jgi:L-methionine (R)-S-oxide reductase